MITLEDINHNVEMENKLSPTLNTNRIESLDVLRGFALLGILIMNITSFSNVGMGYVNPLVGAGIEGYNGWLHGFSYLFADMRFVSIFSILFGAGILLFSDNATSKGRKVWKYHYRRTFFLLIFGLIHAYLIWMGDILVPYAICGSMVFLMRKWKNKTLLILSGIFFMIPILLGLMTYLFTPATELQEIFSFVTPSLAEIIKETEAYRGSYLEQMPTRISDAIMLQTLVFLTEQMWRVLSMMLLGMVLYRKGILSAERDISFYKKLSIYGILAAFLFSGIGLYRSYNLDWEPIWNMNVGHFYNYIGALGGALAYVGLVMWWSKSNLLTGLRSSLRAVGRMAFTNYILSSLICTFIFYGHGLGLFGTMDRLEQWGVILFVWIILLIISPLILKKYKQGPLEWLWRKLTYLS